MKKFKQENGPLNDEIEGINVESYSLEFRYLISVQPNKKVEFAFVNALDKYIPEFPQICSPIKIAKEKATQHHFRY